MSEYTIVADVGNSLVKLFQKNMVPDLISKPEMIGLCAPNEPGDFSLTVYLYHMEENGEARRNDMIAENTSKLRYPPLSMTLNYLITAHSKAPFAGRCLDENLIMGRVAQILNDNRMLEQVRFDGTEPEAATGERLQIEVSSLSYDELRRIWSFPNTAYKLSVGIAVKPVYIDSRRIREVRRVTEAEFNLGIRK